MLFHPTSGSSRFDVLNTYLRLPRLSLGWKAVKPAGLQGRAPNESSFCSWSQVSKLMDKFLHQLGSTQDCKLKSNKILDFVDFFGMN